MHLIDTQTLQLLTVTGEHDVKYAILSHRWEGDEVLYDDMKDLSSCHKAGVGKLKAFCKLARQLNHQYVWMDTCCIDKRSSAELSEAINSMYSYYERAEACIAYLSDVHAVKGADTFEKSLRCSVWFTRCWTLQELLAPRDVAFYNSRWEILGKKAELAPLISDIARIDISALEGIELSDFSIAERMAWASHRHATRPEDVAYSLMGIFDVNMPMLYGEGHRAFTRLQEEILRYSDDETIFAWTASSGESSVDSRSGLLAASPTDFQHCRHLKPSRLFERTETLMLTSRGLAASFSVAATQCGDGSSLYVAFLNASFRIPGESEQFLGIFLRQVGLDEHDFERVPMHADSCVTHCWKGSHLQVSSMQPSTVRVHVRHRGKKKELRPQLAYGFDLGKTIRQTSTGWSSMFSGNITLDGQQVKLAPDANWAYCDDIAKLVVRLPPRLGGPVCNIAIDGAIKDIAFIQLGLSWDGAPICIIVDNFAVADRDSYPDSYITSTALALESFDAAHYNAVPWTENQKVWRDHYVAFKMLPDQVYTGIFALRVELNEAIKWLCLQPDLTTGRFKNRANWIVKLTPYEKDHQKIWTFELEASSKIVLY